MQEENEGFGLVIFLVGILTMILSLFISLALMLNMAYSGDKGTGLETIKTLQLIGGIFAVANIPNVVFLLINAFKKKHKKARNKMILVMGLWQLFVPIIVMGLGAVMAGGFR